MKAVEFETMITQSGQIVLPAEFLGDIPTGQQLKVVVMVGGGIRRFGVARNWTAEI